MFEDGLEGGELLAGVQGAVGAVEALEFVCQGQPGLRVECPILVKGVFQGLDTLGKVIRCRDWQAAGDLQQLVDLGEKRRAADPFPGAILQDTWVQLGKQFQVDTGLRLGRLAPVVPGQLLEHRQDLFRCRSHHTAPCAAFRGRRYAGRDPRNEAVAGRTNP